jgi:hypothetical protein
MNRFDVMHKAITSAKTIDEAIAAYEIVCLLNNNNVWTPIEKTDLSRAYRDVMMELSK